MEHVGEKMNSTERLISIMRQQGTVQNPPRLVLGEMLSENTCRVAGYKLDKDDLLVAEHLKPRDLTISATMKTTIDAPAQEFSVTADVGITKQTVSIKNKLKKGDEVLLYRISEDKYVIIEKVVSM